MKKKFLALILLVPILLIPILSCDGDILGSLSELMGTMGTNSLIEGGVVVIDTSQGERASESMSTLADLEETDPGYDDAYDAEVDKIKKATEEALASKESAKAKKFVDDLKNEPKAKEDAPKKVQDKLDELASTEEGGLGIEIIIETEGDLLAAVLLTELIDHIPGSGATPDDVLVFISDAKQVIDIVRTVSPVNGITIDSILRGFLEGSGFEDFFIKSARAISRDGENPIEKALGIIKPVIDSIIKEIGVEEGIINLAGLKRMISSFAVMKLSYENIAPLLEGSGQQLKLADIVNYALSVVFTEADKLIKDFTKKDGLGFKDLINAYIAWDDGDDTAFNELAALFGGGEGDPTLIEAALFGVLDTLESLLEVTPGAEKIQELLDQMKEEAGLL